MKKRKSSILGIFLCFMLFSCSDELEMPEPEGPIVPENFGITDARHYFEENAADLAPLRFTEKAATKTSNQPILELSPDWKQAMLSGHSGVSLVEVPIRSNSINIYTETLFKDGKKVLHKRFISRRRLVIARRSTGETDMFVITLVPLPTAGGDVLKSMENFRYLGGGDFTGRVFCSTLDGKFVKAFGYTDGQVNGTLLVMKRSELEKHADEGWNQQYSSITLQEGIRTRAGTYAFDEGGGGGTSNLCPHGYPDGSCPICMDEVVVVACPYCHVTNGCVCSRCFDCGNKEAACTCSRCWVCGHKLWQCTCYSYPDPDPNPGGGGGGGGGHVTPPDPEPDPKPDPGTDPENKDTPPQIHTVTTTDQLSRENIANFKRKAQRGNTCVPTVMEYISKLLNNGENYNRKNIEKYFKTNLPDEWKKFSISTYGVPTTMIPGGMFHFFGNDIIGRIAYGSTFFDYKTCINSGNIVMTNVEVKNSSGKIIGWHNLLIIGYTKNGNYIYIDPNDSTNFYECCPGYLESYSNYKYSFEVKLK